MTIDGLHSVDLLVFSYLKRRKCTQAMKNFIKEAKLNHDAAEQIQPARGKHLEEIVDDFLKFGEPWNAAGHVHFANKFFALATEYTTFRQQTEAAGSSLIQGPSTQNCASVPMNASPVREQEILNDSNHTPGLLIRDFVADCFNEPATSSADITVEKPPTGRRKSKKLPIHKRPKLQNLTFREAQNVPPVTVNPPPVQINAQGMVDLFRNNSQVRTPPAQNFHPSPMMPTPQQEHGIQSMIGSNTNSHNQFSSRSRSFTEPKQGHLIDPRDGCKKQNRRFLKNPVKKDEKMNQSTMFLKIAKMANTKIANPVQEDGDFNFNFEIAEDFLDEVSIGRLIGRYSYGVTDEQPENSHYEYRCPETPDRPSPVAENYLSNFMERENATESTHSSQDSQSRAILDALSTPASVPQLAQPLSVNVNQEPVQSSSTVEEMSKTLESRENKPPKTEISPKKEVETPAEQENQPIVYQEVVRSENLVHGQVRSRHCIRPENMFKPKKRKIDMNNAYAVLDHLHSNK